MAPYTNLWNIWIEWDIIPVIVLYDMAQLTLR